MEDKKYIRDGKPTLWAAVGGALCVLEFEDGGSGEKYGACLRGTSAAQQPPAPVGGDVLGLAWELSGCAVGRSRFPQGCSSARAAGTRT